MNALQHSCWMLDHQVKSVEVEENRAVLTVKACHTQLTRQKKGLTVFPCKPVRHGYLKAFAETFNPEFKCNCRFCPPDERPGGAWCQWEFVG